MTTNDIKNLSIALEALSRIPESKELSDQIRRLLRKALQDVNTEQPSARVPSGAYTTFPKAPLPSAPAPYPYNPSGIPTDDDTPF